MQNTKFVSVGVLSLMLVAALTPLLFAQSDAARLQGVITDQSSALVPGAKIRVTQESTNRVLETDSQDTGTWSFAVLPPGNYVIEVSKEGFKPIKQNVELQVAQVA